MEVRSGCKQSDVGVIPEDWEVKTLNEVSIISRLAGAEYTSLWEEAPDGEIIALRGFNIGQGKIIERDLVRISNKLSLRLKRSRLCKGDVVYPCVGSIGNAVVINDDDKYHIQQNIARITPDLKAINPDYLANYLMSFLAVREVERSTSSSSQPSVLVGSLRQYQVPLPPTIDEQRAIAGVLSDVDVLIGVLEQLIVKKRDLKQAAMQQLLTGQTRLPGFTGKWEMKRLGDVATFHKGKGLPKSAINFFGAEFCIHYGELFTQYPETIRKIVSRTDSKGDCFRSVVNDVLMPTSDVTPRGLAKASCIGIGGVILGGDILVIRSDARRVFGSFLSYLIRYEEDQVLQLVNGTTVFHLYGSDMKKFMFSLPSVAEQMAIVAVLDDMDAELAVLEQRLAKTRDLKQGMMQELLTGRTRLV
jgi:type I restriction enzyme S subunit